MEAGCDDAGTVVGASDASADSTTGSTEGGDDRVSIPFDVEAGSLASVPDIYFVHASPDAPPLRFCFGLGAPSDAGVYFVAGGLPASPTLYPGTGAAFDDHGIDLDTQVEIFALNATNTAVAASTDDGGTVVPCEGLIGSDGLGSTTDAGGVLRPGRDYWWVGTIPMAAPDRTTTLLAAVTGCVPHDPDASALCPAGYDPSEGNLRLLTWSLDTTTTVTAGALGAQFAQASSEWEAFRQANGGTTVAGFLVPGDGGAPDAAAEASTSPWASSALVPVAVDAGFGSLSPPTLVSIAGLALDGSTAFGAEVTGTTGTPVPPTPFGSALPGALGTGAGFAFVLVGNPAESVVYISPIDGGPTSSDAGGVLNGHYPHFLAFPVGHP
jgi:hypothetical protein